VDTSDSASPASCTRGSSIRPGLDSIHTLSCPCGSCRGANRRLPSLTLVPGIGPGPLWRVVRARRPGRRTLDAFITLWSRHPLRRRPAIDRRPGRFDPAEKQAKGCSTGYETQSRGGTLVPRSTPRNAARRDPAPMRCRTCILMSCMQASLNPDLGGLRTPPVAGYPASAERGFAKLPREGRESTRGRGVGVLAHRDRGARGAGLPRVWLRRRDRC